jgi:CubicO group peptidase (beta-lactamase class C family)
MKSLFSMLALVATSWLVALPAAQVAPPAAPAQAPAGAAYVPPSGTWATKTPAEAGMDAIRLMAAIAYAKTQPSTWPKDFSTQEQIFGTLLGPIPSSRADTNGVILRGGYIVAEFGDTTAVDPTYSVAKSVLATVAGVAVRDGVIRDLGEPVGATVEDGGYSSAANKPITWRHHLQQESEWQGEMFGKNANFLGKAAFGDGEMKPRQPKAPGSHYEYNDVRINRFSLSLLRRFQKPIPEVFREQVGDVIGMSRTWQWIPYQNAAVQIDGKRVGSVSGGTRWGGGIWISARDMARFGLLWARGGKWGDKQVLPPDYVKAALTPSANGPDYGYLWWLNTKQKNYPGLAANVYGARGAGSNSIIVVPDHDLVIVWRWHGGRGADAQFVQKVIEAIQPPATAQR